MRVVNDVIWYAGTPLFFVFMFASFAGMFWFNMPTNSPFYWAFSWLSVPIIGGVLLYAVIQRDYFQRLRRVSDFRFWFSAFAIGPVLLLFSAGYVVPLNCAFVDGPPFVVDGTIRSLHEGRGRFGRFYSVTVADVRTSTDIQLDVADSEYSKLAVGQSYRREMTLGRLNIPFRRNR